MSNYIREQINEILNGKKLSYKKSKEISHYIVKNNVSDILLSGLLIALRKEPYSYDTLAAFSEVMQNNCIKVQYENNQPLIDIVGTGGANFKSFNVSTVSSIVTPLFDVSVAKHGNRSSTTKSGSADLLEELGVNINMDYSIATKCLNQIGITFLFAPKYHPAMKKVVNVRKELGIKTIFNILGPLTNPSNVKRQLTGVYSRELLIPVINAMKIRNFEHASVVYNELGADELCPYGKNSVLELNANEIIEYELTSADFGLKSCNPNELRNLPPKLGAERTLEILMGYPSALTDFVIMNTAMALKVSGISNDLLELSGLVRDKLETGKALDVLDNFTKISHEVELIA